MTYVIGGLGAAPAGWVLTFLQDGDELSVPSRPGNSLDRIYGVSAREIVEGNGIAFNATAINAWVLATGGRKQSKAGSVPVFSADSAIFLPAGGPRPAKPVAPEKLPTSRAPEVSESGVNPILAIAGLGLLGVLLFADRKAKKGKKRAPAAVAFT